MRDEDGLQRCSLGGVLQEIRDTPGHGSFSNKGQSRQGPDEKPSTLAGGNLDFFRRGDVTKASFTENAGGEEDTLCHHDDGGLTKFLEARRGFR